MTAIVLEGVGKSYALYDHALDRLREVLSGRPKHRQWLALHPIDLRIDHGEVVGLIGMNGAGKSTLLKLVAGTLTPTVGRICVDGRVSALLELGTGFHPEMSGRDNVYLGGAVQGLSRQVIDALYDEIVAFSGLSPEVMAQQIKTYSSGMLMRLAFSLATCMEPEILIVDEALSVGDAAFARKSFDRIMRFKHSGKTILFCSHALYQVEAICNRVIWLHEGRVQMDGAPAEVIADYNEFLGTPGTSYSEGSIDSDAATSTPASVTSARIIDVKVSVDGVEGRKLPVRSSSSEVTVTVRFVSDPQLPSPRLGIIIVNAEGRAITSAGSWQDDLEIQRSLDGLGEVSVSFPNFALLKGSYWVNLYLLSEDGIHPYDQAKMAAELKVFQDSLEQGIVSLPRRWSQKQRGETDTPKAPERVAR